MIDLKLYKVTTALAKANKNEARTFQPGDDLTLASQYLAMQGGRIRHWAPTTGAATSSVHRTRSEVVGEAFYLKDAAEHVSDYNWQAEQVNYEDEFVFQQAHCDDGNDPTLKWFGRITDKANLIGEILYGLRTAAGSSDPKKKTILTNVDFKQPVHTVINMTKGGAVTLVAEQGSNTNQVTAQLSKERAARPHVFHWGPYNQVNMGADEEPEGDGTLLWSNDIAEFHGENYEPAPVVVADPVPEQDPESESPGRTLSMVATDIQAQLEIWRADHSQSKAVQDKIQTLKEETDTFPVSADRRSVLDLIVSARQEIRAKPAETDTPAARDLMAELNTLAAYPSQDGARAKLVEISAAIKGEADEDKRYQLNKRAQEVAKMLP